MDEPHEQRGADRQDGIIETVMRVVKTGTGLIISIADEGMRAGSFL